MAPVESVILQRVILTASTEVRILARLHQYNSQQLTLLVPDEVRGRYNVAKVRSRSTNKWPHRLRMQANAQARRIACERMLEGCHRLVLHALLTFTSTRHSA
jgi:hypothetical protein